MNRWKYLLRLAFAVVGVACAGAELAAASGQGDGLEVGFPETATSTAAFSIPWQSINAGGVVNASSSNHRVDHTVRQTASGTSSSAAHRVHAGFWYGLLESENCPITMTGDVNLSGSLTSADIIYLVNHVFKGGAAPLPCSASGDVNCNGSVTSADVISMVNHVFKGGPVPCDGCTSPLASGC